MSESDLPSKARFAPAIVIIAVVVAGLLLAGVAVIGILAAIAIPNFIGMQLKAKRSEVPGNVDGIKTAELAYDAAFDAFIPVSSRAEAEAELRSHGGKVMHDWKGGGGWETLGWRPDGELRGVYWVEVDGDSFTVHGLCDVDGDGEYAEYSATERMNATLLSGSNTY